MAAEAAEGGLGVDFLRRFGVGSCRDESPEVAAAEIELGLGLGLGLGLSLGGCFGGVEPRREKRLARSSTSTAATLSMFAAADDDLAAAVGVPIGRALSLPMEINEEEHRKRKGIQGLKRMEAKRRRLEKRDSKFGDQSNECHDGSSNKAELKAVPRSGSGSLRANINGINPPELPAWANSSDRRGAVSQGSVGSQGTGSGSGSSSLSDIESQQEQQGSSGPATVLAAKPARNSSEQDKPRKKMAATEKVVKETQRNMMEEMPCVSTQDGPNGRRIEGFLYKYGKGEEVRIVCVCHGSFLTPAEFVKHAGGGDVANPLRHIVVSSSPSAFL